MNDCLREQLDKLKTLDFQVDGMSMKEIPESFSEIVFKSKNGNDANIEKTYTFTFERYIVFPFKGFDFHDKFNKGIAPPDLVMNGTIVKQTEKMYYINAYTFDKSKTWNGWVPKKSVKLEI